MIEPVALPPVSRARWAGAAVVIVLAAAALTWLPSSSHPADAPADTTGSAMLAVAPGGTIELTDLPEDHQHLYRAAAADAEAFEAVSCYCGCAAFLDHRHLLDCFVRPGGGWERHASECAVCIAEARDLIELRDDGTPLDEISQTIDRRFGGITDTTNT